MNFFIVVICASFAHSYFKKKLLLKMCRKNTKIVNKINLKTQINTFLLFFTVDEFNVATLNKLSKSRLIKL